MTTDNPPMVSEERLRRLLQWADDECRESILGSDIDYYRDTRRALTELLSHRTPASTGEVTGIGVRDMNGVELRLGDRVRDNNESPHTKREYWNPEYEVVWDAPCYVLKHVGGGLPDDNAAFLLKHGGANGNLELVSRAALTAAPAARPSEAAVAWRWRWLNKNKVPFEDLWFFTDDEQTAKARQRRDDTQIEPLYVSPSTIAVGVAVKPLTWREYADGDDGFLSLEAASVVGGFEAWRMRTDGLCYWRRMGEAEKTLASSIDEAKAAAQADYETRIRSALVDGASK